MRLADMYPATLTIILIGILVGIGMVILYGIGGSSAVTSLGNQTITEINDTAVAVGGFVTWIPIIVLIIAAAIIIGIVMKSFSGGSRG